MAETVQQRVAEVLAGHSIAADDEKLCLCGWTPDGFTNAVSVTDEQLESWEREYYAHQAAVLAAEGLLEDEEWRAERDEHHTMDELYEYRMLYNAHAAQGWLAAGIPVVKSHRHSDGEECFGGGWFIVSASLPTGQVSNHYRDEFWDLFAVPEVETAPEWDGHTPAIAAERLRDDLAAHTRVRLDTTDDSWICDGCRARIADLAATEDEIDEATAAHGLRALAREQLVVGPEAEPCPPRPTTRATTDSGLEARLVAQRAATDAWKARAEELGERLDEAMAANARMEEL